MISIYYTNRLDYVTFDEQAGWLVYQAFIFFAGRGLDYHSIILVFGMRDFVVLEIVLGLSSIIERETMCELGRVWHCDFDQIAIHSLWIMWIVLS